MRMVAFDEAVLTIAFITGDESIRVVIKVILVVNFDIATVEATG